MGPRAGLDGQKFTPHRDLIPGPSSPQSVTIPTELPAHYIILKQENKISQLNLYTQYPVTEREHNQVTFITAALHSRLKFIAWCTILNLFQLYQCSLAANIHPQLLESPSLPQASAFPTEVHGVSTTKKKIRNTLNLSTQFLTCLFWPLEQFASKKFVLTHFCLNIHLTTLVNDQLDAQLFYFIIRLLQSSTCFENRRPHHQEVKLY